jgi:phage terminase small subunit
MPGGRGKKKLAALDYLDGNPSKRLIKASGVDGLGEAFVPAHLLDDAKACIDVIRRSMPPELYRKMDSFHLAAFGMAWAVHKIASEEIARPDFEFIDVRANGSPMVSPWLKILNEQAHCLVALGDRLGLDPRSRQALRSPEQIKPSKFQGLIGPVLTEHSESSNSSKN